jgi:hypothetical protein
MARRRHHAWMRETGLWGPIVIVAVDALVIVVLVAFVLNSCVSRPGTCGRALGCAGGSTLLPRLPLLMFWFCGRFHVVVIVPVRRGRFDQIDVAPSAGPGEDGTRTSAPRFNIVVVVVDPDALDPRWVPTAEVEQSIDSGRLGETALPVLAPRARARARTAGADRHCFVESWQV